MKPITSELKLSIQIHRTWCLSVQVFGIGFVYLQKNKLLTKEAYKKADELKIIVHNKNDLIFAENQSKKVNKSCKLFLQPVWGNKQKMIPIIVDHVMKNPKWKISLQTHTYIGVE